MLEITNNLYQVVPLTINGITHTLQPKSSINVNIKKSELPKEILSIDSDTITFREISKETQVASKIKRKKKIEQPIIIEKVEEENE